MSSSGVCSWLVTMRLMHGSIIVLVTMPPSGSCNLFLSWRSIPHPRAHRNKQFPTPELLIDLIRFLLHLFYPCKSKTTRFHIFLWTFSWVYWEKDNGCHNVVKTWTINSKTKSKKKNSLKSAFLIEHFMRTLDRISSFSIHTKSLVFVFIQKLIII